MKIKYVTTPGEEIYAIGAIEEMGKWKDLKCKLWWTEGHIWVTEDPIITSSTNFSYKYVMAEGGQLKNWETGVDRVADLAILPTVKHDPK